MTRFVYPALCLGMLLSNGLARFAFTEDYTHRPPASTIFRVNGTAIEFLVISTLTAHDYRLVLLVGGPAVLLSSHWLIEILIMQIANAGYQDPGMVQPNREVPVVMLITALLLVYSSQRNYMHLTIEHHKIKHQQLQLESVFMSQPEGVLIYREMTKTKDQMDNILLPFDESQNFGIEVMTSNPALEALTGVTVKDCRFQGEELINSKFYRQKGELYQNLMSFTDLVSMTDNLSLRELMQQPCEEPQYLRGQFHNSSTGATDEKLLMVTLNDLIFN